MAGIEVLSARVLNVGFEASQARAVEHLRRASAVHALRGSVAEISEARYKGHRIGRALDLCPKRSGSSALEVTRHAAAHARAMKRSVGSVIVVACALEPQKHVRGCERSNAAAADERPSPGPGIGEELRALANREMTWPDHNCRSPCLVRLKPV